MSFKVEVKTANDLDWVGNGLLFPTEEQAQAYASNLEWRWTAIRETRVSLVLAAANYTYDASLPYPKALQGIKELDTGGQQS